MINYRYTHETIETKEVKSVTCDVCKNVYEDDMDIQEFFHLQKRCGYNSHFGDMNLIKIDICDSCFYKIFVHHVEYDKEY